MAATTFTIANQKGGVGKTTTAINLSVGLGVLGVRTLLVDLDPQANATSGLGFDKEEGKSLYGPLQGEGEAAEFIMESGLPRLWLIPSEVDLAAVEIELSQRPNYLVQLKRCLQSIQKSHQFDAIVLDCPPSLGMISMNGLAAADYLLIALQCEYLAMEGLGQILKVVEQIRNSAVNPRLQVGGILMTMFDGRTNLSRQVVEEVRTHFSKQVFDTVIPRTIRLGEAPSFGKSIFQYDPTSTGAQAYEALAQEVAERFGLGPFRES